MDKCKNCEIEITEDDYYFSEHEVCTECIYNSEPYATITDNYGSIYYKTDYQLIDKYADDYNIPEIIEKYAETINYKSTSAWRGYHRGEAPKGYKCLDNNWFCGFDGFNMSDFMKKLHEILEDEPDYLMRFSFFFSVLNTTNVFSQNFEFYIKKNQEKEFLNVVNNY